MHMNIIFFLFNSFYLYLEALQTSLLFSKEYGLLIFLRKSLVLEEVRASVEK